MVIKSAQRYNHYRKALAKAGLKRRRNDALYDIWSLIHFATGVGFGWLMAPLLAFLIMVTWEPIENFVISPICARFGITFGYESLRNSLSDILFDSLGIAVGTWLLSNVATPPFHWF